jgi:hypothetical protein
MFNFIKSIIVTVIDLLIFLGVMMGAFLIAQTIINLF